MIAEVPIEDLAVGITFGSGVVSSNGKLVGALRLLLHMHSGDERTVWFALDEEAGNNLGRDMAVAILAMLAKVDRAQEESN